MERWLYRSIMATSVLAVALLLALPIWDAWQYGSSAAGGGVRIEDSIDSAGGGAGRARRAGGAIGPGSVEPQPPVPDGA